MNKKKTGANSKPDRPSREPNQSKASNSLPDPEPNQVSEEVPNGADATVAPIVESTEPRTPPAFVVVGVGASAGGLEAFMELLKPLPQKTGMAFVLIPHLDPKHESAMTELLARGTGMQVHEVHHGMRVKPDCVYVIPPNRVMTIANGVLLLAQRPPDTGPPMPIDTFFRS